PRRPAAGRTSSDPSCRALPMGMGGAPPGRCGLRARRTGLLGVVHDLAADDGQRRVLLQQRLRLLRELVEVVGPDDDVGPGPAADHPGPALLVPGPGALGRVAA